MEHGGLHDVDETSELLDLVYHYVGLGLGTPYYIRPVSLASHGAGFGLLAHDSFYLLTPRYPIPSRGKKELHTVDGIEREGG
jgi:hypothetical protein